MTMKTERTQYIAMIALTLTPDNHDKEPNEDAVRSKRNANGLLPPCLLDLVRGLDIVRLRCARGLPKGDAMKKTLLPRAGIIVNVNVGARILVILTAVI